MKDLFKYSPDVIYTLLKKTPSFLKNSNFSKLIEIISTLSQDFEDEMFAFTQSIDLDVASDSLLDLLGSLVGESRSGFNDPSYRAFIKARVLSNISKGTIEEIKSISDIVYLGEKTLVVPVYPAAYILNVWTPSYLYSNIPQRNEKAYELLINATGCGIEYQSLTIVPEIGYFGFDEDQMALGFDVGRFAEDQPLPL